MDFLGDFWEFLEILRIFGILFGFLRFSHLFLSCFPTPRCSINDFVLLLPMISQSMNWFVHRCSVGYIVRCTTASKKRRQNVLADVENKYLRQMTFSRYVPQ